MADDFEPDSFRAQMTKLIADVENGATLDEHRMAQLQFCTALSILLSKSHSTTTPTKYEDLTANELTTAYGSHQELAVHMLDVIAGRANHEIADSEWAKTSLRHIAHSADLLVRLVRQAMAHPPSKQP